MAERRMFAKAIIDSDAFLDMPSTSRLLYYDLAMRADDDGFVNSPRKIMRMVGATNDDMNILLMRKFVIGFESGVVVIKHWRIHNYIRKDTYNETNYKDEKSTLVYDENNAYRLRANNEELPPVDEPSTSRGRAVDTGKVRLGKVSTGKGNDVRDNNISATAHAHVRTCEGLRNLRVDFEVVEALALTCYRSLEGVEKLCGILEGSMPASDIQRLSTKDFLKLLDSLYEKVGGEYVLKAISSPDRYIKAVITKLGESK